MTKSDPTVPTFSYDSEAGAFYLQLRKGKVSRSQPQDTTVVLDLDATNKVIGIEVLVTGSEAIQSINNTLGSPDGNELEMTRPDHLNDYREISR